jgi:hypothetical protein
MEFSSFKKTAVAVAAAAAVGGLPAALAADTGVEYPEGFRQFDHVKSMIVEPGFIFNGQDLGAQVPGLHHIYGNKKAMEGYRDLNGARPGRVIFKDGSVIVFDLLEEVRTVPNVILEGARRAVVVMEKDSRRYATTGGWGFQVFDPVTKNPLLDAAAQPACFDCHTAVTNSDFVFSRLRD